MKELNALEEILYKLEQHEAARKITDERLKTPQSLNEYLDASRAADIARGAIYKWNVEISRRFNPDERGVD